MAIYTAVSCNSWRESDCSQNNRVPVDRYVTPIYVDLVHVMNIIKTLDLAVL